MDQNTKANIEDIYELSPMQQGMLFHTLYTEGSDAYIEQFCYHLTGKMDEALFRQAWVEVVSRHEVLRTSFQWKGISKPVQLVNKKVELPWQNIDWSNLSEEQQKTDFKNFIKKDRESGFTMETAPLMRCTLIKMNETSYEFIWSFHHIILDGWSYPVLQKEVFTFYEALKEGRTVDLPKPLPYKHFILWLAKQDQSIAAKYWKKELNGFNSPTKININSESENNDDNTTDGIDELNIKLSRKLTSDLQTFAKQNQLTLNTIIQGAWSILLSTYSGEMDVLFGGVISGRNPDLKGIEKMAGLFINTLPVRVRIDYDQEVRLWLQKLQADHVERNEYSYSSLVDIQQSSEIPRGSQLFDNILVFENYPLDKSLENGVAGIKLDNIRAFERTSFPLTVLIAPGERLTITIAFENSKFQRAIINQILSDFSNLLESILENQSGKLSDLSQLSEQEKNKILFEWNDTTHNFPDDKCVHDLFESQTEKTPDAIAVESGNKKFTYRELSERSSQVANYLKKSDVQPGDMVGICIERSMEMVTGLLGILKAGCAYVPLDSTYPAERLAFMIDDTNISVLLTTQK
ncbi:MAG: condensation domain-containing protein, partial [Bacteroidota bacterium]|nr:condensation domain-containing protein [Bacteroidota bacterium]